MGLHVATTSESAESVQAALNHYGYEATVETIESGLPTEAKAVETPSTPPVTPEPAKEEPVVTEESTTGAELETAEEQAEEEVQEDPSDSPGDAKKKLLKRIDKLTGNWRKEQGKTAEMQRQHDIRIGELQQQINGLKTPSQPNADQPVTEDPADQKPVRPKRPKLEGHGFDQEAYEKATATYEDTALPAYEDSLLEWQSKQTIAAIRQEQEENTARAEQERVDGEFRKELTKFPDIQAVIAENKPTIPQVALTVLNTWDSQAERAVLLNYIAHHPEEAQALSAATSTGGRTVGDAEFAHLSAVASRHFSRLLSKAETFATKGTKAQTPPAPKAAAPVTPPQPTPAPQKPPVSAAPKPITPVAPAAAASSGKTVEDMTAAEYQVYRNQQRAAKRR